MNQEHIVKVKSVIFELIKNKFHSYAIWSRCETQISIMCSDLPEPTSEENKKLLIQKLKEIKDYLLGQGVDETLAKGLLDDEIERYENTYQISLFDDADISLDPLLIEKYARLASESEGLVGIHLPLNYKQLKRLTNGVYKKTGLIKFYISRERVMYGKLIAEMFEYSQKITIATLKELLPAKGEEGEGQKFIKMFGEKEDNKNKRINTIKEMEMPFYVYRFITETLEEYILLSTEKKELGDYVVTGMTLNVDDLKPLTDSAKLPTKLPYIFAQSCKNKIITFKNHEEFKKRLDFLDTSKANIWDYPFVFTKKDQQYILNQPLWYKWLIWAWLTHSKKGLLQNYPLHIFQVGAPGGGKSSLMNTLYAKSKEMRPVFSGSSSTFKDMIPSFRHTPAKLGYLAESNRFSFLDELLRCIMFRGSQQQDQTLIEGVGLMNDLLEHQKRRAGSGNSSANVNMTARIFAATNPLIGIDSTKELLDHLDHSFLSRWLIYYQTEDHVNMIKSSQEKELQKYTFKLESDDWISLLDYLHSFDAEYDMEQVEVIRQSMIPILSADLRKHYDTRHKHHIECLMDGIVKTRCLFDKDMSFKAIPEDYQVLDLVWRKVISSWVDPSLINIMPADQKINFLPETVQHVYRMLKQLKGSVFIDDFELMLQGHMSKNQYIESLVILKEQKLITEQEGFLSIRTK